MQCGLLQNFSLLEFAKSACASRFEGGRHPSLPVYSPHYVQFLCAQNQRCFGAISGCFLRMLPGSAFRPHSVSRQCAFRSAFARASQEFSSCFAPPYPGGKNSVSATNFRCPRSSVSADQISPFLKVRLYKSPQLAKLKEVKSPRTTEEQREGGTKIMAGKTRVMAGEEAIL